MATAPDQRSRVPRHLRQLLLSSSSSVQLQTQAPYSYTVPWPSSRQETELCPPHWRLPPKRSVRTKLKVLVLKAPAYPKQSPQERPEYTVLTRPSVMRMKDSDDYITARAANPRTGMISPSIGSPSPTPRTPDTPGEALELPRCDPPSPTPTLKSRPALSRANEGRKVSASSLHKWRAGTHGWVSETALAAASPRGSDAIAGAQMMGAKSTVSLGEDRFVVQMPSAREPQPYQYPGRTAAEIEAFEHYRHETRTASGESFADRRAASVPSRGPVSAVPGHPITMPKRARPAYMPGGAVTGSAAVSPAQATTFAPFASPRTPLSRQANFEPTALGTVRVPGAYRDISPHAAFTPIPRKPVGSPPLYAGEKAPEAGSATQGTHCFPAAHDLHAGDLSQLPRIRLVHPELAGIPHMHARRQGTEQTRKCSLGCEKEKASGQCRKRSASADSVSSTLRRPLFDHSADVAAYMQVAPGGLSTIADMLLAGTLHIANVCHGVKLPKLDVLAALSGPNATPEQKVAALKAVASLAVQILVFLMITTAIWRVGTAVAQVLEALLWPLTVPLKILRWLASGG